MVPLPETAAKLSRKPGLPLVAGVRIGCAIIATFYFLLLMAPWHFSLPGFEMDTLVYAFVAGWQWGREIVSTFGPLGFIYTKPFEEATLVYTFIFSTFATIALAVVVFDLVRAIPIIGACLIFFAFSFPLTYSTDARYFMIPMAAIIGSFRQPFPVHQSKIVALTIIAGTAALIKATFGLMSLCLFVILDIARLRQKIFPLYLPVFLLSYIFSYWCSGQSLEYLPRYLWLSAQVVSGYSEAMALTGEDSELALFLVLSISVFCLVCSIEIFSGRLKARPLQSILLITSFALFGLINFKAGFVRQDHWHTVISWAALSSCLAAYTASIWEVDMNRKLSKLAIAASVVLASSAPLRLRAEGDSLVWQNSVQEPFRQITSAGFFLTNPSGWLSQGRRTRDTALAAIRRQFPLSRLDGSVDAIPLIQSAILAHGLNYQPRPTMWEYQAYTPELVEANLQFLHSDRAPKYFIYGTGSIDHRYPTLADGPIWPDLMGLYEPLRFEGNFLLLSRRSAQLDGLLSEPLRTSIRIGEEFSISRTDPIFVALEFRKTLFGRISELLFKPSLMWLNVRLSNGQELRFRIVPGITRKGFFLSPLIENNLELAALAIGKVDLHMYRYVKAMRLDTDDFGKLMFAPEVDIQIRSLRTEKLKNAASFSKIISLSLLEENRYLMEASRSTTLLPPHVYLEGSQLFAHAPARLSIQAPGLSTLTVAFGIRDGAWQKTDGVCFRIWEGASDEVASSIWERCLRPQTDLSDRGEQTAVIKISNEYKGRLRFETDCAGTCAWDWSYWSRIEFSP